MMKITFVIKNRTERFNMTSIEVSSKFHTQRYELKTKLYLKQIEIHSLHSYHIFRNS